MGAGDAGRPPALARLLPALVVLLLILFGAPHARAQYPEPRLAEPADPLDVAAQLFDAGRWDEVVETLEAVARTGAALPPAALRRWGIAAGAAGKPFAAYVRLRQYLAADPEAADRDSMAGRIVVARESLLSTAALFSRVLASLERGAEGDSAGDRFIVRIAARENDVSIEGMSGMRLDAPLWRRAEEIALAPYLGVVRSLLDSPGLLEDVPAQTPDSTEPGPRRTAVLRLVIGDEERRLEALRGEPYERLKGAVELVLDFARRGRPLPGSEPPPAPPRPAIRKRR